jgi:single-strand DNA-binding protein
MTTTATIVGNLISDPDLKYTASGLPVASFGIAVNSRKKDGDNWVDGDPQFYNVTVWRTLAENVAQSLEKGQRVVVTGRLDYSTWETKEGDKRSKVQVVADEVGPSLKWAACEVIRVERSDRAVTQAKENVQAAFGTKDEEPF